MSNIQKFKVYDGDAEVVLAVDRAVLTPELATLINDFWGEASSRLNAQDGDVVLTVVRLFGSVTIAHMLSESAHFGMNNSNMSTYWTKRVLELEHEGWPNAEGLGIRIIEACVDVPDFLSVEIEELDAETH